MSGLIRASLIAIISLAPLCASAEWKTFAVAKYGAVGDGKTLNTNAIARAIDAASRGGGGYVRFPEGRWLSGAIEIKSNVVLYLDAGATLLMSSDPGDYPMIKTRWEGIECYNYSGLIFARDAQHIAIKGKGSIDGQGQNWWRWTKSAGPAQRRLREMGETTSDPAERHFGTMKDGLRPSLIQFINCKDVLLEGVAVKNSPMWAVHPIYCERVVCREIGVSGQGPDTDGIDVDSCANVLIEKCTLDNGGDCIAIKSGRDRDGRRVNRPSEDVTIRDCRFSRGHGAIVIGSETAGGIKNVDVSHCEVKGADRGIWIKTMRGRGGVVEGVRIDDVKMSEIVQTAIEIDMQYNRTPARFFDETTPVVREISIRGVKCEGARDAAMIRGLEESPVSGVTIKDAKLRAVFGVAAVEAQKVTLDHVEVTTDGDGPVLWGERATEWVVASFSTGRVPDWDAVMAFENSRGVTIRKTRAPENTDVFLELIGAGTKEIRLIECDTSKARERVELEDDVPEGAVIESRER